MNENLKKCFIDYAEFYDILYKDKNYKKEAEYIISLFKKFKNKTPKSLLDVGCGTGNHIKYFLEYVNGMILGVDTSKRMIEIAKKKLHNKPNIKLLSGKFQEIDIKGRFDLITALFHVVSYQVSNDDVISFLKKVNLYLKPEGLFIFDFWYLPAVYIQKPEQRIKKFETDKFVIYRFATPEWDVNRNVVNVFYKFVCYNKAQKKIYEFSENHIMRYFSLPEIEYFLKTADFRVKLVEKWLGGGVGKDSWSVVVVAEKEKRGYGG